MRCREQSFHTVEIAASGRLFSSPFALRDVAARRPVSGFGIDGAARSRRAMVTRRVAAMWARHGETEGGRRPTSGEDSAQRSAPRVPGERLCRLTGETKGGRRPTSGEDSAQRSASRVPSERLCRLPRGTRSCLTKSTPGLLRRRLWISFDSLYHSTGANSTSMDLAIHFLLRHMYFLKRLAMELINPRL